MNNLHIQYIIKYIIKYIIMSFNPCMSLFVPYVPDIENYVEDVCAIFARLNIGHVKFVDLQCPSTSSGSRKRAKSHRSNWQATLYFDHWFRSPYTEQLQQRLLAAANDEAIAIQVSPTEHLYVARNQFQTQSLYKALRERLQYVQKQQAYHREALAQLEAVATSLDPELALEHVAAKCALAVLEDDANQDRTVAQTVHQLDEELVQFGRLSSPMLSFSSHEQTKFCLGCCNLLRGEGGQNQLDEHTCFESN